MQRPVHQLVVTIAAYVSAAVLAVGSLLDAFVNAREVFSPAITFVGSLLLLLIWLTAATCVRLRPVRWVIAGGQSIRIHRLGFKVHCIFVGVLVLLWIPRISPSAGLPYTAPTMKPDPDSSQHGPPSTRDPTPTMKHDTPRASSTGSAAELPNGDKALLNVTLQLRIGGFEITVQNVGQSPATGVAIDVVAWQVGAPGAELILTHSVRDLGPRSDFTIYRAFDQEGDSALFNRTERLEVSGYLLANCVTCSATRAWAFHLPSTKSWFHDLVAHERKAGRGDWVLHEFDYPKGKPPVGSCVDIPGSVCASRTYLWSP